MTGESIDYEDVLSRWKCNRIQAANDLERLLLRDELPSPGSVARAIVTLREEPGWISVEDHLPPRDENYKNDNFTEDCIATGDGLIFTGFFVDGVFHGREVGYEGFGHYPVTHWMPLPELPKEEEKSHE